MTDKHREAARELVEYRVSGKRFDELREDIAELVMALLRIRNACGTYLQSGIEHGAVQWRIGMEVIRDRAEALLAKYPETKP